MNTVRQHVAPFYELGHLLPTVMPRRVHTVTAPGYPLYEGWALHGMGQSAGGPGILKATAPIVGTIAMAAGAAGPLAAGIALLVGTIAGLWAAHPSAPRARMTKSAGLTIGTPDFPVNTIL